MAFDYKKEHKEFYLPPQKPGIVDVPEMHFIAVRGKGNPNDGAASTRRPWACSMASRSPSR